MTLRARRTTALLSLLGLGLSVGLSACGDDSDEPAGPVSTSAAPTSTPTPTPTPGASGEESEDDDPHVGEDSTESGPRAIAIGDPQPASSFSGDDTAFATELADLLEELSLPAPVDDTTAVSIGKDFCSVLSGGGLLARKVDFWADQHQYAGHDYASIFQAALDQYCHNFLDAYLTERTVTRKATVPEEVDVVRFVGDTGLRDGAFDALPDDRIATEGAATCRQLTAEPELLATLVGNAAADDRALLTGYVLGFCPEVAR